MSSATKPDLCVSVTAAESSIERGQTAYYIVSVWTRNGTVSGVDLKLSASPSSQSGAFSLDCPTDGGASCNIGTVASTSTTREVEAKIAVASSATSVDSVTLTVRGTGSYVKTDPVASASTSVTTPPAGTKVQATTPPTLPNSSLPTGDSSTLPLGGTSDFPSLNGSGSSYTSDGGSASGLFPTINPSSQPDPSATGKTAGRQVAEPAADTTTLPLGTPMIAAQAAGLGALLLACVLAVTRLQVRRRSNQSK
jgi:hypothetical protein